MDMMVIGTDTHKAAHMLAAVCEATGKVRGVREISADEDGHRDALRWAQGLDGERVWAIEDCRHVSGHLEQALLAAGERVVRVAPHRTGASRKGERQRGKCDEVDALTVARVVVADGVDAFPCAELDEQALEIRLLVDRRDQLVRERTREIGRLRWHLVALCPLLERYWGRATFTTPCRIDRVEVQLRELPQTVRMQIALETLARIRALSVTERAIERELRALVGVYAPQLLAEQGCATITAALLIGRLAGAGRFRSEACLSRHAGAAPIPCSSGQRSTLRLDHGGDRQLNRALHTIAITRARIDPTTQAYLARKRAEGKTSKGALRCLKRYLARRIYRLLTQLPPQRTNPPLLHTTPPAQPPTPELTTPAIPALPSSRCF